MQGQKWLASDGDYISKIKDYKKYELAQKEIKYLKI